MTENAEIKFDFNVTVLQLNVVSSEVISALHARQYERGDLRHVLYLSFFLHDPVSFLFQPFRVFSVVYTCSLDIRSTNASVFTL